ncbi:MAG: hypothetical protein V3U60_16215 [Gammaproteobacteria bacterium]
MKWSILITIFAMMLVAVVGSVDAAVDADRAWWGADKYDVVMQAMRKKPAVVLGEFTEAFSDLQALLDGPNWSGAPVNIKGQLTARLRIALQTDANKRQEYQRALSRLQQQLDLEAGDAIVLELKARLDALPPEE